MKMKINSKDFRVREGDEINLRKWPTNVAPVYKSKGQYHKFLAEHVAQLSVQQQLLYSSNRYAVLMIFQAIDAAGKDGAIKHVMSGVNPQGCQVFSFKHPSPAELQHDFLWGTEKCSHEGGGGKCPAAQTALDREGQNEQQRLAACPNQSSRTPCRA
jgi:polyphosphate kinase 2 (PPK2 family)